LNGENKYLDIYFKNQPCFACGVAVANNEFKEKIFSALWKIKADIIQSILQQQIKNEHLKSLIAEKKQGGKILNQNTLLLLDKSITETENLLYFNEKQQSYYNEAITAIHKLLYNLSVISKIEINSKDNSDNITKELQDTFSSNYKIQELVDTVLGEIYAVSYSVENMPNDTTAFNNEIENLITDLKTELERIK